MDNKTFAATDPLFKENVKKVWPDGKRQHGHLSLGRQAGKFRRKEGIVYKTMKNTL